MSSHAAKLRVLVTDKIDAEGLKPLEAHPGIDLRYEIAPKPEVLEKALVGVGAWLVRSETKITADWIGKAVDLRLIGRAGVGVDNIDLSAATRRGIAVVNAPAANTLAAAEHAVALMLSLARHVPQADASTKAGKWERGKFMGVELFGKTLGVVGLGRIGREVAKRAQSFGMRIAGFDPFVTDAQAREMGIEPMTMLDLLARADFVTLHVPGGEKTKHMISGPALAKAKKGLRLINCARGELVDEAALAAALKDGVIAGAALDVFSAEPLPADSPLRGAPNLILTPHLGASTQEAQSRVATELAQAVLDFHDKGIAPNALNLPGFDPDTLAALGEWLPLAESLGRFLAQMLEGGVGEFTCSFEGEFKATERRPLSVAALKGFLTPILGPAVSWISAPAVATDRGIRVGETVDPRCGEGVRRLLTLTAVTDKGPVSASGTVLAPGEPRILKLGALRVDVRPLGKMIVIANTDAPGVIGRVGTLLGKSGVNIADMRVGRRTAHGEAVMVLTVDDAPSPSTRAELSRLEGIRRVHWVEL
ncbi:MAG: phosphoglycerate dehydrogenase [Elusimicrobia bacterium]|nr:phosphoglycerate dehydrogenase [Elusimicrobiota bacterium]